MKHSPRAALALLSVCVFLAVCTEMLPVGLLPEIGRGLDVSESGAGVLVSLYAVLVAVLSVPMAAVTTRWPRRSVLAVLLGAYTVSNVIFAAAPGYAVAVVARVIGGAAHAGFFAVAVAAAVSLVGAAHVGRALTVVLAGNAVALVLGVPLGTALGTALGWRWAFVVLAVAIAGLALAVLVVLPDQPPARSVAGSPARDTLRRPAVLLMAAVISLLALGHFTVYTYISPLLQHAGVARTDVGAVLFAYGCGGLIGVLIAGATVARRPDAALGADIVLMGLSLLLAAVVSSAAVAVVVVVVWGVAFGAFPTLTQAGMLRAAGPDASDAAAALVNATTNAGIAGGALLGAQLLRGVAVPGLGWVGAALVAGSLAVLVAGHLRPRSLVTETGGDEAGDAGHQQARDTMWRRGPHPRRSPGRHADEDVEEPFAD